MSDATSFSSEPPAGAAKSATQRVVTELRKQIIQGKLAPGDKLKVETLKTVLNTGASPIREALSLLTSDQLVERRDQRGFRVTPVSAKHFREILMLRCKLEDIALRDSIEHGDTQWEESLVLAHHRLSKASRGEPERWEQLHKAFHTTLLIACGSPILLRFTDQLYDLNIRYRYLAGKSGDYDKRDIDQEHEQILQATLARDKETAVNHLMEHYTLTGNFLAEQFN
jgi:DNA-binding GntR family transcriptional regulator